MRTWIAVAVTLLFWSSGFSGIREGLLGGYSPGQLSLFRFLVASAVFALYAFWPGSRMRLPEKQDFWKIVVLGWIGITVYHLGVTFGEQTVSAGTAGLLIGSSPAFTALFAHFVLKDRLGIMGWVGLTIGFAGIVLITVGDGGELAGISQGALLVLLASVATSIFFVLQKPLFARYRAMELTAYFTWAGTIPMLVFLPGLWEQVQTASWQASLSVVYIGIFPTVIAYVTWAYALSSGRPGVVSSALYLEPVLALIVAWLWLGEIPTVQSLVGGLIVIAGVAVVGLSAGRRPAKSAVVKVQS